jgi:regulator of protease activity HflC (stomatin/prohibitin superfamily)
VVYFRVVDSDKAVLQVSDFYAATSQLAQTRLRSVLGQHELDEILAKRDQINHVLQESLDLATDPWGIKISDVEMKDVDIDESMVRAIARQAEAERDRRAKVIHAEGEYQAAEKLRDAAGLLSQQSQALQLRYLQTMADLGGTGKASTIVFPLPLDLFKPLTDFFKRGAGPAEPEDQPEPAREDDAAEHLAVDAPEPPEAPLPQPPASE